METTEATWPRVLEKICAVLLATLFGATRTWG